MLKNITITVSEDTARWARRRAADENTSVSKLVGRMLESEMRRSDAYRHAFEQWKKLAKAVPGVDASRRVKREELYDRR